MSVKRPGSIGVTLAVALACLIVTGGAASRPDRRDAKGSPSMHVRIRLPASGDVTLARVVVKTSGRGKRRVAMHARNAGAQPDSAVVAGALHVVKGKRGVFAGLVAIVNRKSPGGARSASVVKQAPARKRSTSATVLDVVLSGLGTTRVRPSSVGVANDLISTTPAGAARAIVDRGPRARSLTAGSTYLDPGAPAATASARLFLRHVIAVAAGVAHGVSKEQLDQLVAVLESDVGGNLKGGTNKPPVPAFGFAPNSPPSAPKVGQAVAFNGHNSADADGEVVKRDWSFGDASAGEGKTTTYSYAQPGIYDVQLQVVDDDGRRSDVTARGQVYVSGPGKTEGDSRPLDCPVNSGDTLTIDWFAYIAGYAERPVATTTNPCPGTSEAVTVSERKQGNDQGYTYAWNRPMDTYHVQIKWTGPGPGGQATQHLTVTSE